MGRKKPPDQIYLSSFSFGEPQALERQIATDQQVRFDTDTIRWGEEDDALPMRILTAINNSPTTSSCLGKVADFMQGAAFTDPGLMLMPVDQDGTTLWDFHARLCDYMAKLEGFATRFTYDYNGDITNAYIIGPESCRFVRPVISHSRKISEIRYNPYWGTSQYNPEFTDSYPVFSNPDERKEQINFAGTKYKGQVYFFGNPRPPYKFYPVPKYWSGADSIYTDANISSFIKKWLDNGFFQSVLINMIGDPTQPSKNPKYYKRVTGEDGTIRTEWDGVTTVGKEFEEMMSKSFSGHDKAGKAMVFWAMNKDAAASIQPFPSNTNFEVIDGLSNETIRKITIATEVQAVLANLPQQSSSLGSDGESMRMAIELMHARVKDPQNTLEQFYNTVLLPNMQTKTESRVKIKNHVPLSNQVQVPDKVWEWMNDEEKADFVRTNIPGVKVIRTPTVAPGTTQTNGQVDGQVEDTTKINGALKGLKTAEIDRVTSIVRRVDKGKLTYDQGVQLLQDYGFNPEQIKSWLTEPQEEVEI